MCPLSLLLMKGSFDATQLLLRLNQHGSGLLRRKGAPDPEFSLAVASVLVPAMEAALHWNPQVLLSSVREKRLGRALEAIGTRDRRPLRNLLTALLLAISTPEIRTLSVCTLLPSYPYPRTLTLLP